jgi:cell division protease FtsH
MANALMKYETIDGEQIDQIMEGREPDPPEDWSDADSDQTVSAGAEDPEGRSAIGGPAEQV